MVGEGSSFSVNWSANDRVLVRRGVDGAVAAPGGIARGITLSEVLEKRVTLAVASEDALAGLDMLTSNGGGDWEWAGLLT
jgi:hypothetical protein